MNDLSPIHIPSLLRAHGLTPKKSLGQNFLVDSSALARIVEASDLPSGSCVLEAGPGLGSLTRYLAHAAARVVAVELDAALIPVLEDVLSGVSNVEIIHGDILEIDPAQLMGQDGYFVVANIPYYITSNLIRHLLQAPLKPRRLVLTVQLEVAQRITAEPGDMSLLALSVQLYGKPKVVTRIPAEAFYPTPKVDSSVVRVDLYSEPLIPVDQLDDFFTLAKAGFGQKRKTLRNSLSAGLHISGDAAVHLLTSVGIDPMRRAETLSMDEWKMLTQQYRQR